MNIYLQSFFSEPKGYPFSVSRWQPRGYNYYSLDFFKPIDRFGNPIKEVKPEVYIEYYSYVLIRNYKEIKDWLDKVYKKGEDISLLCWCNKERQKKYNKLYCHTILIGYFLEKIKGNKNINIIYLDGRDNPIWIRGEFYNTIKRLISRREV